MALTNAERQRQWRKKHPTEAQARLEAHKARKAKKNPKKTAVTECDHDDRGVRVELTLNYCGKCRQFLIVSQHAYEEAHKVWLSRSPERDGEG